MSNPTTPFSWQMPTATDLVTDLPADFEVFGQAVATSMADLLGGTTGQVLSKTTDADMDFTWVAANPGDITGVTAGVGITGGGTSGTVTVTNDMATTITAAGDIVVGTGSGTYDNLPIGTTNQILTADTTVSPYKVKWATPATTASGLTKITSATFSAVTNTGTTFDDVFTSTYNNYKIVFCNLNTSAAAPDYLFQLRTSGPTTKASQYYGNILSNGSNATQSNTASYKLIVSGAGEVSGLDMTFFRDGTPACWAFNGFQRASNQHVTGAGFNDGVGANAANGFILSASTGTISGFVAVYGLAD